MIPVTIVRDLEVNDVHPFSGLRAGTKQYDLLDWLPPDHSPTAEWLVLAQWPSGTPACDWVIEIAGAGVQDGAEDAAGLVELLKSFKVPEHNWPEWVKDGTAGQRFRACRAVVALTDGKATPGLSLVTATITVDTCHPAVAELTAAFDRYRKAVAEDGEKAPSTKEAGKDAVKLRDQVLPRATVSAFLQRQAKVPGRDPGAEMTVHLKPKVGELRPMPGYPGYVAIDLGNTGSMLGYMAEDAEAVADMRLLELDEAQGRDAIPTAVRFKTYQPNTDPPDSDEVDDAGGMPEATWDVGRDAEAGPGGTIETAGLILGAKRLLSDPNASQPHRLFLNGSLAEIPKAVPAELYLARLVEKFHGRKDTPPRQVYGRRDDAAGPNTGRPRDGVSHTYGLAVTCPTTFTHREIEGLRRAVYSGWRRALGGVRYRYPKDEVGKVVAEVIDEASAAALFFVYKDLLRGPGLARGLHHLYPHGANLLVYDCGGGTTDIALVQVYAEYEEPPADRVSQLHIDVIGRTGHRGFGGDDITEAVFQVIKAKLAVAISGQNAGKTADCPKVDQPNDAAGWAAVIAGRGADLDKLVPTKFNRDRLNEKVVRDRATVVMGIWQLAEEVKTKLGVTEDWKPDLRLKPLINYLAALNDPAITRDRSKLEKVQKELAVRRDEVNAVVGERILQTVARANGLIRRRMHAAGPDDETGASKRARGGEVHKVYVIGNASKYPLIMNTLRQQLDVPFLTDDGEGQFAKAPIGKTDPPEFLPGRLEFDTDNLKGAVVKGALALLRLRRSVDGVTVRVDNQLIHKLPFNIWYDDIGVASQLLYREGDRYDSLPQRDIPKPADLPTEPAAGKPPGDPGRIVFLKRQWPDESLHQADIYLTFRFPRAVTGTLQVEYVAGQYPRFKMTDTGSKQTAWGEEKPAADYVSKPQSGEL